MQQPNAEAILVWNDIVGPKFTRHREIVVRGFTGHSDRALELYPVTLGQHVLDVGCGFGDTTLTLARAVGPSGRVVGHDCVASFLELARADARAAGVDHVTFQLGDAQTDRFEPIYDRIFARFGTMFFASPVAAMRNLRTALKPGGLLTMVVWRGREVNEWVTMPRDVVLRHVGQPPEGPTCGPGPFSMAEPETVTQQLEAAGWRDLAFHPIETQVDLISVDKAVALALDLGPAGELMRFAGAEGERLRPQIVEELREGFARFATPAGLSVGSRSWCVAARNPG